MLTSLEHVLKKPEVVKKIVSFLLQQSRRKDLEACRCVSKLWNDAISDAISCFNRERTRFLLLHECGNQVLNFEGLKKDPYELNLNRHLHAVSGFPGASFTDPVLYVLGSCNGLICFLEQRNTVVLWNPKTGKSRIFEQKTSPQFEFGPTFYGFGYDQTTQRYKVIVGGSVDCFANPSVSRVDIFERETESWRNVQDPKYSAEDMECQDAGFYFRGGLYWLGENNAGFLSVVRFDLVQEKFEKVYNLLYKDTSIVESPAYFAGATKSYPCYFTMNLDNKEITIWKLKGKDGRSEFTTFHVNKSHFAARTFRSQVCVKDLDFDAQTFRSIHIIDDRYVLLLTSTIRGDEDDHVFDDYVLIVYDMVGKEVVSMLYDLDGFVMYKETSEPVDSIPSI